MMNVATAAFLGHGVEDTAVDNLLLECAEEPLDDTIGLRLTREANG